MDRKSPSVRTSLKEGRLGREGKGERKGRREGERKDSIPHERHTGVIKVWRTLKTEYDAALRRKGSDACSSMDEPRRYERMDIARPHFRKAPGEGKFRKTEHRTTVTRRGGGCHCLTGTECQLGRMGKFWRRTVTVAGKRGST